MSDLQKDFDRYDRDNPHIWRLFVKFAFTAINRGYKHYSANGIFERIRWHIDVETNEWRPNPDDPSMTLKLCNNHRAYYARKFHKTYPQHDGFFRTRELRSETDSFQLTPTEPMQHSI